jgi:hypothetical protein
MKLTLTPAKNEILNPENEIGWTNMMPFGSGYLEFISRDHGYDFEPAAALSNEANEALADLPVDSDEGWGAVAYRTHSEICTSFWSALTTSIDLRPGMKITSIA